MTGNARVRGEMEDDFLITRNGSRNGKKGGDSSFASFNKWFTIPLLVATAIFFSWKAYDHFSGNDGGKKQNSERSVYDNLKKSDQKKLAWVRGLMQEQQGRNEYFLSVGKPAQYDIGTLRAFVEHEGLRHLSAAQVNGYIKMLAFAPIPEAPLQKALDLANGRR